MEVLLGAWTATEFWFESSEPPELRAWSRRGQGHRPHSAVVRVEHTERWRTIGFLPPPAPGVVTNPDEVRELAYHFVAGDTHSPARTVAWRLPFWRRIAGAAVWPLFVSVPILAAGGQPHLAGPFYMAYKTADEWADFKPKLTFDPRRWVDRLAQVHLPNVSAGSAAVVRAGRQLIRWAIRSRAGNESPVPDTEPLADLAASLRSDDLLREVQKAIVAVPDALTRAKDLSAEELKAAIDFYKRLQEHPDLLRDGLIRTADEVSRLGKERGGLEPEGLGL